MEGQEILTVVYRTAVLAVSNLDSSIFVLYFQRTGQVFSNFLGLILPEYWAILVTQYPVLAVSNQENTQHTLVLGHILQFVHPACGNKRYSAYQVCRNNIFMAVYWVYFRQYTGYTGQYTGAVRVYS